MNHIQEILESLAFIVIGIIMIKILSTIDDNDNDNVNEKSFFKVETLRKMWVFFIGFKTGKIILIIICIISN